MPAMTGRQAAYREAAPRRGVSLIDKPVTPFRIIFQEACPMLSKWHPDPGTF